jgi:hypothetical protein
MFCLFYVLIYAFIFEVFKNICLLQAGVRWSVLDNVLQSNQV